MKLSIRYREHVYNTNNTRSKIMSTELRERADLIIRELKEALTSLSEEIKMLKWKNSHKEIK